jgi:hypothetical protein
MDFPSVPDLPGVPAVARLVGAEFPLPVTELADAVGLGSLLTPKWGIFNAGGKVVLTGDSTINFDAQKDYRISDAPVTKGGFTSLNKVATPGQFRFTFVISGVFSLQKAVSIISATSVTSALQSLTGQGARIAFLTSLEQLVQDANLYTVHTPDQSFVNVNITHYNYRRDKMSAALLPVDVWVEEVRQTGTATTTTTTQSASGAPTQNGGTVQATTPTAAQSAIIAQGHD